MGLTGTLTGVSLAGLLASAALLAVINAKNVEERGLRATIAGHDACDTALGQSDLSASAARCPAAVAAVHRLSVQAAICDQALTADDAFVMRASCPTSVKTLSAERDAALGERDASNAVIAQLRTEQAAAIVRAETRGFNQAQRIQSAQTQLAAAPRNDAGLGRCDAECLRGLGGAD